MSGLTLESMKVSGLQVYIPLSLDLFGNFITTVDNQLFWSVMFPTNRITQEHARLYTDRALEIAAGSIQEWLLKLLLDLIAVCGRSTCYIGYY